jgi:hypothetical protein
MQRGQGNVPWPRVVKKSSTTCGRVRSSYLLGTSNGKKICEHSFYSSLTPAQTLIVILNLIGRGGRNFELDWARRAVTLNLIGRAGGNFEFNWGGEI